MDERERLLDASTTEVVAGFSAYYRADLARLVAFLAVAGRAAGRRGGDRRSAED